MLKATKECSSNNTGKSLKAIFLWHKSQEAKTKA
jgi:hypothetical protein